MKFIAESFTDDFVLTTRQKLGERFKHIAKELQQRVRARFMTDYRVRPSVPGGFPSRITGQMARSIKANVVRHGGGFIEAIRVEVTNNERKRATLFSLEKGNKITPKNAKYIAIPLTHRAKVHVSKGGTARNHPEKLKFVTIRRRGMVTRMLVKDTGKSTKKRGVRLKPVYYLTRGPVTVKPRAGLAEALGSEMEFIRSWMNKGL